MVDKVGHHLPNAEKREEITGQVMDQRVKQMEQFLDEIVLRLEALNLRGNRSEAKVAFVEAEYIYGSQKSTAQKRFRFSTEA
ncbi:hypothetical protein CDL15_Pgr024611 [Punica granatum]|uniref:Uncharacterized protein n=1 Tax=Punica granatum TaxID=22663 RepID=A0A218W8G0_PUNGR|nr:hypothetical protein CDL15_Pgr024611 [Punica granatum]